MSFNFPHLQPYNFDEFVDNHMSVICGKLYFFVAFVSWCYNCNQVMSIFFQLQDWRSGLEALQTEDGKLTQSSLAGNDENVKFLTRLLTYHILSHLFDFVSSRVTETHRSSLTKFRQLLLVLIKLRLNVSNELLAFVFDVTQFTVSRIFLHMLSLGNCQILAIFLGETWKDVFFGYIYMRMFVYDAIVNNVPKKKVPPPIKKFASRAGTNLVTMKHRTIVELMSRELGNSTG